MRDLGKMMKQMQKLQQEVSRVQEEMKAERVEATAGGGVVRARESPRRNPGDRHRPGRRRPG